MRGSGVLVEPFPVRPIIGGKRRRQISETSAEESVSDSDDEKHVKFVLAANKYHYFQNLSNRKWKKIEDEQQRLQEALTKAQIADDQADPALKPSRRESNAENLRPVEDAPSDIDKAPVPMEAYFGVSGDKGDEISSKWSTNKVPQQKTKHNKAKSLRRKSNSR